MRDASGAEVARLEESSNDSESIFRSRDGNGQDPWEKEGGGSSEGARLKSADVGVDRFGLSRGPSAALGSVAPEEPFIKG